MQLSTLRSEVRYRAGVDPFDAMASDAVVTAFINGAIRQVTNMRDWDWSVKSESINTVIDQVIYDRAADARTTVRVLDWEGSSMQAVTPVNAARYSQLRGWPRVYFVESGKLVIYPKPSKVLPITHVYLATEAALSADSDEPTIPDYAIDLVIIKAALMLAARVDNTSQHRLLKDEERFATETLQDDARRSKASPQIDVRRDWTTQRGYW